MAARIMGCWTLQLSGDRWAFVPADERTAKYDFLNDPSAHDRLLTDPPIASNPTIRVVTEDGRVIFEEATFG